MIKLTQKPTPEMKDLLRAVGSSDIRKSEIALRELAVALTLPLKQGVISGDIVSNIFSTEELEPGAASEYPLDLLAPGTEKDYVAWTCPNQGRVPEMQVEGDYVMVPTYPIMASIDWLLRYARDARWNIIERAMQVLEGMMVKKSNNDGFHTILAAGTNRNLVIYDSGATAGLFSKRLVSLTSNLMRRYAGGNSTSVNKGRLTHIAMSPEAIEDMRSWDLSQVDDITRREIYLKGDDADQGVNKVFGKVLIDIDELGEGQEYQNYYVNVLGGSLPGSKLELLIGLDLDRGKADSFMKPVREMPQVWEDVTFHRQGRASLYSRAEFGFTCLDSRRVLLMAA